MLGKKQSGLPSFKIADLSFDSDIFRPGQTFSHKFNTAGTYDYFCMIHPWMDGKVIVKGSSATPTPDSSRTYIARTAYSNSWSTDAKRDFNTAPL